MASSYQEGGTQKSERRRSSIAEIAQLAYNPVLSTAPSSWFVDRTSHKHQAILVKRVFVLYGLVGLVFAIIFISEFGSKSTKTSIGPFIDEETSTCLSSVTLADEVEIHEGEDGVCGEVEIFTELEGSAYFRNKEICLSYMGNFFRDSFKTKTEEESDELAFVTKHTQDNVQHKYYIVQPSSATALCNIGLYGENLALRNVVRDRLGVYVTGDDAILCLGSSDSPKFCSDAAAIELYAEKVGDESFNDALRDSACAGAMDNSLYITIVKEKSTLISTLGVTFSLVMVAFGVLKVLVTQLPGLRIGHRNGGVAAVVVGVVND